MARMVLWCQIKEPSCFITAMFRLVLVIASLGNNGTLLAVTFCVDVFCSFLVSAGVLRSLIVTFPGDVFIVLVLRFIRLEAKV